jgi:hypothetical protein
MMSTGKCWIILKGILHTILRERKLVAAEDMGKNPSNIVTKSFSLTLEHLKTNLTEEFFFNHKYNWHQFNAKIIKKNLKTDTRMS